LLTATLHATLLGIYVWAFGGDVSALVCADASKIGQWPYEDIHVGFPAGGFDGQFYYVLARDPWRQYDATVIDLPAYRHARILYPALAWALSGGDPVRLLWVLPTINLLAIVSLSWLGARLAVHFDRSAWWGVLLPLVLNTGMSALRNLTDPLATVMACGLLTAWLLRWPVWQLAAWAFAAALSREQNVLIISIVLFEALRARCRSRAVGLVVALLLGVGWVITLKAIYGARPLVSGYISPPFAGMWYRWTHLEGLSGAVSRAIHVAGMLLLSFQVGLSIALVYFRANRLSVLIALVGAALAISGGTGIYLNGWSYSRVFLWMPLGIWLWSLESGRRWPALLLTSAALWSLAAVAQAWSR
jgi:hypothetical protein